MGNDEFRGYRKNRYSLLRSVMIPRLRNINRVIGVLIDQPIRLTDPARPVPGPVMPQRFRLSGPLIRRALDLFDQGVDPPDHLLVCRLPVQIVLPSILAPDQLHSSTSGRSIPFPASSSAIDRLRRCALVGLDNKCMVSCMAS